MKKIIAFIIRLIQRNNYLIRLAEDLYTWIPRTFMSGKAFSPLSVLLLITYRCNLRCSMCYYYNEAEKSNTLDLINRRKSEELTREQIMKLIDEIAAMNVKSFTLHGGEPLTNENLFPISKYAVSKGLLVNFFTNGILLDEPTIDKIIDAKINTISISIDAPAEVHDKIRGLKGAFDRIINGIAILKRKEKEGLAIPRISIVTSVSGMNQDSVLELYKILKSSGIAEWNVAMVTHDTDKLTEATKKMLGLASKHAQGDLSKLPDEVINVSTGKMLEIRDALLKENADAHMEISFPSKNFINKFEDPWFNESEYCMSPWSRTVISPYGEVCPCIMLSMIDANMGNIREKSFREIWNGDKYVEFRKKLKKNKTFPICSKCCFINEKTVL
jgi:Fe-coproporphyrin III synthase